ncbi:hypothetical protein K1719_021762 [Acacia pycnantha]|nr:hypothetical protein K1719_021762 [Acacia pycnantha]
MKVLPNGSTNGKKHGIKQAGIGTNCSHEVAVVNEMRRDKVSSEEVMSVLKSIAEPNAALSYFKAGCSTMTLARVARTRLKRSGVALGSNARDKQLATSAAGVPLFEIFLRWHQRYCNQEVATISSIFYFRRKRMGSSYLRGAAKRIWI